MQQNSHNFNSSHFHTRYNWWSFIKNFDVSLFFKILKMTVLKTYNNTLTKYSIFMEIVQFSQA